MERAGIGLLSSLLTDITDIINDVRYENRVPEDRSKPEVQEHDAIIVQRALLISS
jgi:hypothetical protein